jgi:hypothetical protein
LQKIFHFLAKKFQKISFCAPFQFCFLHVFLVGENIVPSMRNYLFLGMFVLLFELAYQYLKI